MQALQSGQAREDSLEVNLNQVLLLAPQPQNRRTAGQRSPGASPPAPSGEDGFVDVLEGNISIFSGNVAFRVELRTCLPYEGTSGTSTL